MSNLRGANLHRQDVAFVCRKSFLQLQQHHDDMKRTATSKELSSQQDSGQKEMEDVLCSTRREMAPQQAAMTCAPAHNNAVNSMGTAQFGVPFALNTDIAAAARNHNLNQHKKNQHVPFTC